MESREIAQVAHRSMMTWGLGLFAVLWLALYTLNAPYAKLLMKDDNIVEWTQFGALLLGCIYFLLAARKDIGALRLLWSLSAIFAFVLAMEEISWGQRVFAITTPETLESFNVQGEMNLHNLRFVHDHRHWYTAIFALVGLVSTFVNWRVFESIKPARVLRWAFVLLLLTSLSVEYAEFRIEKAVDLINDEEGRKFAGRFMEVGELAFALAVFSYARQKYYVSKNRC